MFTGIVQEVASVRVIERQGTFLHYGIEVSQKLVRNLEIGASVAVDGICQSVVKVVGNQVFFDAISETLEKTTLQFVEVGRSVNVERAAKFGDEIGGHVLSGHVYGKGKIDRIEKRAGETIMWVRCPPGWMKYFFSKGFIALDGASLTLVDVDPKGLFSVHLIPETLRRTTFGVKTRGSWINIEFDSQTQAIVETVERILKQRDGKNKKLKKSRRG